MVLLRQLVRFNTPALPDIQGAMCRAVVDRGPAYKSTCPPHQAEAQLVEIEQLPLPQILTPDNIGILCDGLRVDSLGEWLAIPSGPEGASAVMELTVRREP